MSLLIKGMEMPDHCGVGCICFERCRSRGLFAPLGWCHVTKNEIYSTVIPDDCPLIPIPKHGRLHIRDGEYVYVEELPDIEAEAGE